MKTYHPIENYARTKPIGTLYEMNWPIAYPTDIHRAVSVSGKPYAECRGLAWLCPGDIYRPLAYITNDN